MESYAEMRKKSLNQWKKDFIMKIFADHGWNVSHAAEALGMDRGNFHRLLRTLSIVRQGPIVLRPRKPRSPSQFTMLRSHCSNGHSYDEVGWYKRNGGGRSCKKCSNKNTALYRARKRREAGKL